MKKILIVCMPFDNGLSGISVYIKEITKRLGNGAWEVAIDVMLLKKDRQFFPADNKNINYIEYHSCIGSPLRNIFFYLFYLPIKLNLHKWFVKKENRYDAVLLPAGNRRMCAFYPYYTVAIVHDFSPLRLPGKYDKVRELYIKYIISFFLRRVDCVLAVSHSTMTDVMYLAKLPESSVSVCYPGCNVENFPAVDITFAQARNAVKKQWGIKKQYLLFVSRIEHPGKNHIGLMKAYAHLSTKQKEKYDLVFAGSAWNNSDKVRNFACNSSYCYNFHFLGFVTNEELSLLYRGTSLFVFPSFYEGFGFPVLEAMAHEVPVVLSNRSSLLELSVSSKANFDPNFEEDIAKTISNVLESPRKKSMLVRKGLEHLKMFSWEFSIDRLYKFLMVGKNMENAAPGPPPIISSKKDAKEIIEQETLYLERRELFGVPFVNASLYRVLTLLKEILRIKVKVSICFLNVNSVNLLQKDMEYKKALLQSDYVFPDGMGIRMACMLLGFTMQHNLNGTDLFPHLLELCQAEKKVIYFLGSKKGVARTMSILLKQKYPKLKIAGTASGYFDKKCTGSLIRRINASRADILFVGMGSPLQEKWIYKYSNMLNTKIILGVGGLFDFYSENKKRAPQLLRKLGLEWAFRLYEEPERLWQRYLIGNIKFLIKLPILFFYKDTIPSFLEDKGNE